MRFDKDCCAPRWLRGVDFSVKHYPHHISDFNNATRHLNRIERGLYRDLLDLYYETEKPLPTEVGEVARRIVANELSTDVERMLNEFFIKTPQGWYHERCDEEIGKYQSNNSQRAQAGKASAAKKALKKHQALNGDSTGVEIPLNENSTGIQNQSTNKPINHKPVGEATPLASRRATRKCPVDFLITEEFRTWAALECPAVDVDKAALKFRDHTFGTAKTDWDATLRNWIRKDAESCQKGLTLPAWREQQRAETQKAVPRIALGAVNPNTFFTELGASNVTALKLG